MKIRWYHWLLYRLYHAVWGSLLEERPHMVRKIHQHMGQWLNRQDQKILDRRASFHVITKNDE